MKDWDPDIVPPEDPISPLGWALFVVRVVIIAAVIYSLMILLFLARLIESLFKKHPVSPVIVQLACRLSLLTVGLRVKTEGKPMRHNGAVVSNHGSWLDIFALNAPQRVYFVSKAEVSKWPLIGMIARSTGTVFIERKGTHAKRQKTQFEDRLVYGDRLLFFPEGTSTDTLRVLPFKSSLFAAFFEPNLIDTLWIQPVTLNYKAPLGKDGDFYGWWGEMEFFPHFAKTLGAVKAGQINLVFHEPVAVKDFPDRKALALYCEEKIRSRLDAASGDN